MAASVGVDPETSRTTKCCRRFREAGPQATLLKKRLWHRCFLRNFAKFLRTPFLQNTSGRLLPLTQKAKQLAKGAFQRI